LKPFKYISLPLGSIKASGWLHNEIRLSGDGLGGHLYDFYRFVRRSTWLGGDTEYSELAESATYWFNYIVPLAWVLDDDRLKDQARAFLDYTLEHQAEDGWLGPEKTRQTRGIWARSLLFFGLMVSPVCNICNDDGSGSDWSPLAYSNMRKQMANRPSASSMPCTNSCSLSMQCSRTTIRAF
jgi:hypothetical protein